MTSHRLAGCVLALVALGPAPLACAAGAGEDIPNALTPFEGILVGGQPTEEQIRALAAAGYRTIVNTRTPGEKGGWDEGPLAEELGLRFEMIPMAGAQGLTEENARRLAEILDADDALPALVHCASGNRVGGLFALKAFYVDGLDPEAALKVGLDAGLTRLEGAVRERLAAAARAE